jgi:hypothetical protein
VIALVKRSQYGCSVQHARRRCLQCFSRARIAGRSMPRPCCRALTRRAGRFYVSPRLSLRRLARVVSPRVGDGIISNEPLRPGRFALWRRCCSCSAAWTCSCIFHVFRCSIDSDCFRHLRFASVIELVGGAMLLWTFSRVPRRPSLIMSAEIAVADFMPHAPRDSFQS